MRWMWIDRFTEFESGVRATAIKAVTMAEDHLHDHFPGFPVMPTSLMVEGMAQTGGILLGEKNNFDHIVILAKVPNVTFHSYVVPGETIEYAATLVDANQDGGSVECRATVGERLVADCQILFVHLDQSDPALGAIDQKNFVFSAGLLSVMEVGKMGDQKLPSA